MRYDLPGVSPLENQATGKYVKWEDAQAIIKSCKASTDHWRKNHDDRVKAARLLLQTAPAEQGKAYNAFMRVVEENAALKAAVRLRVPHDWRIKRATGEPKPGGIYVSSPITGPGGKVVWKDDNPLADRLLWQLCNDMLGEA